MASNFGWPIIHRRRLRVRPLFAWFDLWVGVFVNVKKRLVVVMPLPMIGFTIEIVDTVELAPLPPPNPSPQLAIDPRGITKASVWALVRHGVPLPTVRPPHVPDVVGEAIARGHDLSREEFERQYINRPKPEEPHAPSS